MNPHVIHLTDPSDRRLAPYRSLRYRGDQDGFIAEGRWVVERLLRSGRPLYSLLLSEDSPLIHHLSGSTEWLGGDWPDAAPLYTLPKQRISELVGYPFHRGVLAHGPVPDWLPLERFPLETASAPHPVGLALLGVTDPENVGSLLRTAAAMGVQDVLVGPGTISPYSRRAIRVSMASVFSHRLYRLEDPVTDLTRLTEWGVRSVATTLSPDATPLFDLAVGQSAGPVVLVMGNEADGLPEPVQRAATVRATLPMGGDTDSLNVSVAGAIFLYELTRLRQQDFSDTCHSDQ